MAVRDPRTKLFNAALSGATADKIADPNGDYWPDVDAKLQSVKATNAQVQVIWFKTQDDEGQGFPTTPST